MYAEALTAFLGGILGFAVLVGFAVMVDRFWINERLVKITLYGAGSILICGLSMTFIIPMLFTPPTPGELPASPQLVDAFRFMHTRASEFGYVRLYGIVSFSTAGTTGVLYVLSPLISSTLDREEYGVASLIFLAVGLVTLIGFLPFFKGLSAVLTVVATVIGILVGVKKLTDR